MIPTCMQVSSDYPDSIFVYPAKLSLDANVGNTYWMWYQLNEIGFMAGVVAAFVATDGNEIVDYAGQNPGCKLGCIFGADGAGFYRYADGFAMVQSGSIRMQKLFTTILPAIPIPRTARPSLRI